MRACRKFWNYVVIFGQRSQFSVYIRGGTRHPNIAIKNKKLKFLGSVVFYIIDDKHNESGGSRKFCNYTLFPHYFVAKYHGRAKRGDLFWNNVIIFKFSSWKIIVASVARQHFFFKYRYFTLFCWQIMYLLSVYRASLVPTKQPMYQFFFSKRHYWGRGQMDILPTWLR